jgi:hypothetical protein
MLERKEKEDGEGERLILAEKRVSQCRSGKIESRREDGGT